MNGYPHTQKKSKQKTSINKYLTSRLKTNCINNVKSLLIDNNAQFGSFHIHSAVRCNDTQYNT